MARADDAGQIKQNYIWNTLGSLANAFASVALLMVATRCLGAEGAGVFSLAYALGQQFQIIGAFEMRPYQATDVRGKYPFSVYLGSRIVTTLVMIAVIVIYSISSFGLRPDSFVLICVCGLRILDVVEDVFQGALQQAGRLDIAGRALFLRVVITSVSFCAGLVLTRDIAFSSLFAFAVSVPILYLLNVRKTRAWVKSSPSFNRKELVGLLRACFPLFAGSFLQTDLTNVPRLAIRQALSFDMQTIYSALFMPALVINLLSGFMFKPLLTTMAERWESGKRRGFVAILCRCGVLVGAATLVCCTCAFVLGIPVLSLLYGIDLDGYRAFLMTIMVGGGLNAANIVMYYALVTMRQQRVILAGYILAALASHLCSTWMVSMFGMSGAAFLYVSSMSIVFIVYMFAVVAGISGKMTEPGTPAKKC